MIDTKMLKIKEQKLYFCNKNLNEFLIENDNQCEA